jgi:hypothetical protein
MGRIDHLQMRRASPPGEGVKQFLPDATPGPAHKPVVDRGVGAVTRRQIALAAAGLQHMQDAADDPAIIDPLLAAHIGRQVRLDASPLFIR